jgi:hypothetical protein
MKSTLERELKDLKLLERNRTTSGLAAAIQTEVFARGQLRRRG